MYGNSLLKYTRGGDKTSQYSYLVAILSNWVPDNWVYRLPSTIRNKSGNTLETLSEQILNFQVSYGWRSQNPGKYRRFPPQIHFRIVLPPVALVPFPFWKGPLHGTARAGHELPNSTGGTSETWGCRAVSEVVIGKLIKP